MKAAHEALMNYFVTEDVSELTLWDQVQFYLMYGTAGVIAVVSLGLGMWMNLN